LLVIGEGLIKRQENEGKQSGYNQEENIRTGASPLQRGSKGGRKKHVGECERKAKKMLQRGERPKCLRPQKSF